MKEETSLFLLLSWWPTTSRPVSRTSSPSPSTGCPWWLNTRSTYLFRQCTSGSDFRRQSTKSPNIAEPENWLRYDSSDSTSTRTLSISRGTTSEPSPRSSTLRRTCPGSSTQLRLWERPDRSPGLHRHPPGDHGGSVQGAGTCIRRVQLTRRALKEEPRQCRT